ncbi:hypothetical protein CVT24_008309 [Panaeolus cyanescens]|uniref:G domain-containing protein n=1 Tax=Panaeolus cyanescens TaxID=181874 RepID=A0A409YLS8_9AGAR|nr:hypothetical protein CVT24_008309 [Panaeolus cyanescens]
MNEYFMTQTGDVSVGRHKPKNKTHDALNILLFGGTGSGKSSFIEALAGNGQALGISGDALDSVTQDVQAFKVKNLSLNWVGEWWKGDLTDPRIVRWPVRLVDTPGFMDTKLSALETMRKVQEWQDADGEEVAMVFYFCRITDKRVPGSAMRNINIINNLRLSSGSLTIVTTMWDQLHGEASKKRAEENFQYLRDVIWQVDPLEGRIVRFSNTHASAIEILTSLKCPTPGSSKISNPFIFLGENTISSPLFAELLNRIQNTKQEKQWLEEERIRLLTTPDQEIESNNISSLKDVDVRLTNYINQMIADDDLLHGMEVNIQPIVHQHLEDFALSSQRFVQAIENVLQSLDSSDASRRDELVATLHDAKIDFQNANNVLYSTSENFRFLEQLRIPFFSDSSDYYFNGSSSFVSLEESDDESNNESNHGRHRLFACIKMLVRRVLQLDEELDYSDISSSLAATIYDSDEPNSKPRRLFAYIKTFFQRVLGRRVNEELDHSEISTSFVAQEESDDESNHEHRLFKFANMKMFVPRVLQRISKRR